MLLEIERLRDIMETQGAVLQEMKEMLGKMDASRVTS
jgi:hypothetical protein